MCARDLNTLAASAEGWYPTLLQPVHLERAGPITRATPPILNVVFGDATVAPNRPLPEGVLESMVCKMQ